MSDLVLSERLTLNGRCVRVSQPLPLLRDRAKPSGNPDYYSRMSKRSLFSVVILLALTAAGLTASRDGEQVRVTLAGGDLPAARLRAVTVDSGGTEDGGVDRATISLELGSGQKPPAAGDAVRISIGRGGDAGNLGFNGEVVYIEPSTGGRNISPVTIRAFNKLHRLNRGRKSKTYQKQSDADIARAIAAEAGLGFAPAGPEANEPQPSVSQHNQTDLEFIRTRAARLGYSVWVDDSTLHFERAADGARVSLGCSVGKSAPDAAVRAFHPRLSAADVVKKVIVRGWNPSRKEEIVGEATRPVIALSERKGGFLAGAGQVLDLGRVVGLETEDTLYGAANGALAALSALDVSAEVDTDGHPLLGAGTEVTLTSGGKKFEGKYLVVGASHRYERGSNDGWHTFLRVVRTDHAVYEHSLIGVDVLIIYDQNGEYTVIGSLWNGIDKPTRDDRFCS